MSSNAFGLVEMLLTFSIPLAWAGWEVIKMRRERRKDAEREAVKTRDPE